MTNDADDLMEILRKSIESIEKKEEKKNGQTCNHPETTTYKAVHEKRGEVFITECIWCKKVLNTTPRFTIHSIKSIDKYNDINPHWHRNDLTRWAIKFEIMKKRRRKEMDKELEELIKSITEKLLNGR